MDSVFEIYDSNPSVEESLTQNGLTPDEKIITRDGNGHMICHYIKVRDYAGRRAYVELDCDESTGMGYVKVDSDDPVLTAADASNQIDYSSLLGAYDSNKADVYGISFECDDSVCVMTHLDGSLSPNQQTYRLESSEDSYAEPVAYPVVKMTELLANPGAVRKSLQRVHDRIRDITFSQCHNNTTVLKQTVTELQRQAELLEALSAKVSTELPQSMGHLEKLRQSGKIDTKTISFNLSKRNELALDYINLCQGLKKYSMEIKEMSKQLTGIYQFSEQLFDGLDKLFVE